MEDKQNKNSSVVGRIRFPPSLAPQCTHLNLKTWDYVPYMAKGTLIKGTDFEMKGLSWIILDYPGLSSWTQSNHMKKKKAKGGRRVVWKDVTGRI